MTFEISPWSCFWVGWHHRGPSSASLLTRNSRLFSRLPSRAPVKCALSYWGSPALPRNSFPAHNCYRYGSNNFWETIQFMFASGFEQERYQRTTHACSHIWPATLHPKHQKTWTREHSNVGQRYPMCPNLRQLVLPIFKQHGIKSSLLSKGDKKLSSILTNIPMSNRFFFSKKDCSIAWYRRDGEVSLPSVVPGFFASSGNESTSSSLVEFA